MFTSQLEVDLRSWLPQSYSKIRHRFREIQHESVLFGWELINEDNADSFDVSLWFVSARLDSTNGAVVWLHKWPRQYISIHVAHCDIG